MAMDATLAEHSAGPRGSLAVVPGRGGVNLRILVDSRMMYMSGIGRYIRCLLPAISRLDDNLGFDLLGYSEDFRRFLSENGLDCRRFHHYAYSPSIYGLREQVVGSMQMLKNRGSDIVHIPHFNAPWLLPAASVVTVHDIIPFKLAHLHHPFRLQAARQVLKNSVEKAARIIVVSDATAADLTEMFPESEIKKKIRRIYLGVSEGFQPMEPAAVEEFKTQNRLEDYILYVGNRMPHKNLGRLARAFVDLKNDFPGLKLVVAGKRFTVNDELDQVIRSGPKSSVIEWGQAGDRELQALYCGARALVFPSLYEGFGLPPLEAMACGTPVVVSNKSSLPEVVGEAGVYVNPEETEDIARGIQQVLTDSGLRSRLSTAGIERARRFQWQDTARDTLAVYREAANTLSADRRRKS